MADRTAILSTAHVVKGAMILLGLFFVGGITVLLLGGRVIYDLDLRPEDYGGILSHLAIISLITERFVEIFASVIRTPDRVHLEGDLRKANTEEGKHQAHEALAVYKANTSIFTIVISFITGLVIASVGVRVLGPLFNISELTTTQKLVFDAIDIVITAGLIAGGSKGINTLTSSIGAVFDAMKIQSRANQERARKDLSN